MECRRMEIQFKSGNFICPFCEKAMKVTGKSIIPNQTQSCYIAECTDKTCLSIVRFQLVSHSVLQSNRRSTYE